MIDSNRKCLFIASEVRSGSTYVAESLAYELANNFGYFMWPLAEELFSFLDESSSPGDVIETWRTLYLDPSSGFAPAKIMCKALSVIHRLASCNQDVKRAFFGENAYWLVIRRRDRIKQAVSLAIAIKAGTYHYYGNPDESPDNCVVVSNAEINSALQMISLSDIYLQVFASTISESRIVNCFYEDFMADEVEWLNRVHAMCNFQLIEPGEYINQAKLKSTAIKSKQLAYAEYSQWLLQNYV
ncbi:hypothetical protein [Ferribacterium limneticum]|uniref:hypothetical protein n=1 Tax=Ferribacterium limneticum TaxID=76259 RepID=UPI001CF9B4D0|nr:hypothetical protein [Ferribacterium limneticum]UCV20756.1 hypothetical protein KI610_09400 [Ferribacterium limneticum]